MKACAETALKVNRLLAGTGVKAVVDHDMPPGVIKHCGMEMTWEEFINLRTIRGLRTMIRLNKQQG